jgi:hypothetical protein
MAAGSRSLPAVLQVKLLVNIDILSSGILDDPSH